MYAPPPVAVAVVPARRGFTQGPILAICCLGIILFLIAATIVLALIPLYIPKKTLTPGGTTDLRYFTLLPANSKKRQTSNTFPYDGTLSSDATNTINSAIAVGLGFPSDSIESNGNGIVSSGGSKRKRRGFGLDRSERSTGTRKCYLSGRFRHDRCGLCRVISYAITITSVTFIYGTYTLTITFTVSISVTVISIPATVATTTIASSNTTTIASSANTTTTVATTTSTGVLSG